MTQPLNIHHQLYRGPKVIADPGAGGTITVDADLQICEITSATTETRTLSTPSKAGIRFHIRMLTTDDVTVTAAGTVNVAGNNTFVLADIGDALDMISVTDGSAKRWDIVTNTGSVSLSTV